VRVSHIVSVGLDDSNLVSAAGLVPVMGLAERSGLHDLVGEHVRVPGSAGANGQAKVTALRAAGLVTARRDGRHQVYRVEDPHILSVIEQVFGHIAPDGTLAPDRGPGPRPPAATTPVQSHEQRLTSVGTIAVRGGNVS